MCLSLLLNNVFTLLLNKGFLTSKVVDFFLFKALDNFVKIFLIVFKWELRISPVTDYLRWHLRRTEGRACPGLLQPAGGCVTHPAFEAWVWPLAPGYWWVDCGTTSRYEVYALYPCHLSNKRSLFIIRILKIHINP